MEREKKEIGDFKNYLVTMRDYKLQEGLEEKIIEKSMFRRIISLLRSAQVADRRRNKNSNINFETTDNEETLEAKIQRFSKMNENAGYYIIPELMLFMMSAAHNDWIINKLNESKIVEQKERFVPFELLSDNNVEKYSSVLLPIFDAVKIEYDVNEMKNQLKRKRLVYMFKNALFTSDSIKKHLQNIQTAYPQIYAREQNSGELISKKLKEFIDKNNIAETVEENIEIDFEKRFKDVLKSDTNNVGILKSDKTNNQKKIFKVDDSIIHKKIGFKKSAYPHPNEPIPKWLFDLSVNGKALFAKNLKIKEYEYTDYSSTTGEKTVFIPYEECLEEQKKHIDKRERKIDKFVENVKKANYKKYSDTGLLSIIVPEGLNDGTRIVQLEITKKELADSRILPSEVGWEKKKKALINSKNSILIPSTVNSLVNKKQEKQQKDAISKNQNEKFKERLSITDDFDEKQNTEQLKTNSSDSNNKLQNNEDEKTK